MSIPGIFYGYNATSTPKAWDAFGRPSLPAEVDLFQLGVTKPTTANTGSRVARSALTVFNGDLRITTAGFTVSKLLVLGRIIVEAANVTVEDCIVEAQAAMTSTRNVIDTTHSAARNLTVRFTEASSAAAPNIYINGIGPKSFTAYRSYIHDVVDCGSVSDSTGFNDNITYEGCLLERSFYLTPDPTHTDNRTHDDLVQSQGGPANLRIQGSTLRGFNSPVSTSGGSPTGRSMSCVMLNTNATRTKSNVQILDNWIDGGGDSINGRATDGGTIQIKRNRFGRNRDFFPITANITLTTIWDIPTSGVDANVWEDTGLPLSSTATFTQSSGTQTVRRYF